MSKTLFKLVLPILAIVCLATPADAQAGVVAAPGDSMPDLRGRDHAKGLVILDYGEANYTLINFWASWCEPCKNEIPMLQRIHEELGPEGLQVVGVTSQNISYQELGEFGAEMKVTYPLIRIGDHFRPKWPGVSGVLPNSFLIASDGHLLRRYVGAAAEQIVALEFDLRAVIEGRELGPFVLPTEGSTDRGTPDMLGEN